MRDHEIHPDDNFEPERARNWSFLIFWLSYAFLLAVIVKACVF